MKPLHNPLFLKFIVYFNENQDYFECHEVLEEFWKSIPNRTKNHPLTAYILLSTGLYHFRRDNKIGAQRTLLKAYSKMTTMTEDAPEYTEGIDFNLLCKDIKNMLHRLENNLTYQTFQINIISKELELLVSDMKLIMDLLPIGSDDVIHKHMLRDRTDILLIRDKKKKDREY
ncbi:DUF309 domain-containing protein [Sporosarcina siberiensis]|uniref:DUF309 domain-containing protein n=1 Tax=Sporosarcina siberiensis TaxID=1365606 RepID=A0ABW4SFH8_9BACL